MTVPRISKSCHICGKTLTPIAMWLWGDICTDCARECEKRTDSRNLHHWLALIAGVAFILAAVALCYWLS